MDAAAHQNLVRARQLALDFYFVALNEDRSTDASQWEKVFHLTQQQVEKVEGKVPRSELMDPEPFAVLLTLGVEEESDEEEEAVVEPVASEIEEPTIEAAEEVELQPKSNRSRLSPRFYRFHARNGETSLCVLRGYSAKPYKKNIPQSALFRMADILEQQYGMAAFDGAKAGTPATMPTRKEIEATLAAKGFPVPKYYIVHFAAWLLDIGVWTDTRFNARHPVPIGFAATVQEQWDNLKLLEE